MRNAAAALLGLASILNAGETGWVIRPQREAEAKALQEDWVGAAKLYGEAIARAHKNDCPYAEQLLVWSLQEHMQPLWKWGAGADGAGRGGLRDALHAMMGELDEERSGGLVSAHALAEQLVLRAIWTGDDRHLKDAAKVLAERAREDDVGKAAGAMNELARGVAALRGGRAAEGIPLVEGALATMAREGWTQWAIFAGTELAAAHLAAGKADAARDALGRVAKAYPDGGDIAIPVVWQAIVEARLKGAPAGVLAPYATVMEAHGKRGAVHPPPGQGEPGSTGGRNATSLLGRKLDGFSKRKPLMTAERTGDGFELRQRFDGRFKETFPYLHGVRHKGNQGLSLAYWGYAVALAKFDPTGTKADPSPAIWPDPFQAFYPLASGETYAVNKRGEVSVES